jgi:predicted nucleotidyltransferase
MVKSREKKHKLEPGETGDRPVTPASLGGPSGVGEALFPKIRRKVLALFLLNPDQRYYFREAARLIGDTPGSIQRELKSLTEVGILTMEPIGIQKFYQANKEHPVFNELRSLTEKTFGLADILRDVLRHHADKIVVSFIFGSVAVGRETGKSDIDLLVVGSISLRELVAVLEPIEKAVGRPINPALFSKAEFVTRAKKGDHFVTTLLGSEKLFILGNANDLERLAEK